MCEHFHIWKTTKIWAIYSYSPKKGPRTCQVHLSRRPLDRTTAVTVGMVANLRG